MIAADGTAVYPWNHGETLTAAALNAAIASGGGAGPFLPLAGGTMTGPLNVTATGGNTVRSVQDRAAEVFNVRDYGAKMDGTTDDYAAVNAAITAAAAVSNSVVYFPPSPDPCMLSQSVVMYPGMTFWAYPGSAIIKPTPANAGSVLLIGMSDNVVLYGLTIDGGGQDFPSASPLTQAYRCTNVQIVQCRFQHCRSLAFNGSGVNDLLVRDCTFSDCGNHWKTTGAWADAISAMGNYSGDGVTWGFRTTVMGCRFADIGGDCIDLGGTVGVSIIGNSFNMANNQITLAPSWSAYFAAVFPEFANDIVIADNWIEGASGNAIDCPSVNNMTIAGNMIRNCGQSGIGLFDGSGYSGYGTPTGTHNVTISGNIVENCGQWASSVFRSGINIGGTSYPGSNYTILGNVITDTQATKTQQYGVAVQSGLTITGLWVDASNNLTGNAVGPTNNVPAGASEFNPATPPPIGNTTPNTGQFTTLYTTGMASLTQAQSWQGLIAADAYYELANAVIGPDSLVVMNNSNAGIALRDGNAAHGWGLQIDNSAGHMTIHRTAGTGQLQFNLSGTQVAAMNASSLVMGGINLDFGTAVATSATDLSKHIKLYNSGGSFDYGLNVSSNRLNILAGGSSSTIVFVMNNSDRMTVTQTGMGFNGTAAIAKPTVTGAKGGNAALGSLLSALASYGLVTDSTTA